MTPAEMRAKREELIAEVEELVYGQTTPISPAQAVEKTWDACHALMSEERPLDEVLQYANVWKDCAEKLANALEYYKGEGWLDPTQPGTPTIFPADEALAHFEKLKEGS